MYVHGANLQKEEENAEEAVQSETNLSEEELVA